MALDAQLAKTDVNSMDPPSMTETGREEEQKKIGITVCCPVGLDAEKPQLLKKESAFVTVIVAGP